VLMTEYDRRDERRSTANGRSALPCSGFTLVELIVVVSIAAILLSIAVPSYQSSVTKYRISTEVNGLVGDLQYARSEAIKQGIPVTVCVTADNLTCSGATTWSTGRIVLVNPLDPVANAGSVLRMAAPFSGTDTAAPAPTVTSISFNRDGFAGVPSAASWNGFTSLTAAVVVTVWDQARTTGLESCVVISQIGQISVLASGAALPAPLAGNC